MFSRLLNGAASPANWARKIAGPFTVFMRRLPKLDRASYYVLVWSAYVPAAQRWLVQRDLRLTRRGRRARLSGDCGSSKRNPSQGERYGVATFSMDSGCGSRKLCPGEDAGGRSAQPYRRTENRFPATC